MRRMHYPIRKLSIHGVKKPTMNELSRCSYPISSCPIWSEVGRIKVFTCMLKVQTMSGTIRNSNFLLHVNVLNEAFFEPVTLVGVK